MSSPSPEIILYSYEMAPNPQKLSQMLSLLAIPHKYVELPIIMPRPQLAALGITYRRTPLLSIGSDMYIDTALIISKLCDIATHSPGDLSNASNHLEYDGLGQIAFQLATSLIPRSWPLLHDPAFLADRAELRGGRPFTADALAAIRPGAISKMLSLVGLVEREFLRKGARRFFLGGETPSTADVYLYWGLNWGLRYHEGARPEISDSTNPVVWKWMEDVGGFLEGRAQQTKIEMGEAEKTLLEPPTKEYAKFVEHVEGNVEELRVGQRVKVTPVDSGRSGVQGGELVALNYEQVCLRNGKGLVMHFPRLGYEVEVVEEGGKL
jgi:glutathione S-transferase